MSLESDVPQIHLFPHALRVPLLPNSDITCFKAPSHCRGVRTSLRALNKNDKGMNGVMQTIGYCSAL